MRKLSIMLLTAILLSGNDAQCDEMSSSVQPNNPRAEKRCHFPKSKRRVPVWVCSPMSEGSVLVAVGTAAKSKAGIAFMEQMAEADARTRLAQMLSELKQEGNEANSTTEKAQIDQNIGVSETLKNTKILKRVIGPKGRLYVLVGIEKTGDTN